MHPDKFLRGGFVNLKKLIFDGGEKIHRFSAHTMEENITSIQYAVNYHKK